MMHPENPLIKDMTPDGKRTFLFTSLRPMNEEWINLIKGQIEYFKKQEFPAFVETYGVALGGINENMAANLKMAVSRFEDYITPDPDPLLSEKIPVRLVFDHPKNDAMNHFRRMLERRDVLSDLGFSSSTRNGPIENIPWEAKQYEDKESGRTISYFVAESPNDPKVFLVRTLWPPKSGGKTFVFGENLIVARDKESAISAHESALKRHSN